MHIGTRLKALRDARGYSQVQLANRARLHVDSVRAIETNKHSPNVSTLAALAQALSVSARALLPEGPVTAPWELVALELDLRFKEVRALRAALAAEGTEIEVASEDLVRGVALRRRRPNG